MRVVDSEGLLVAWWWHQTLDIPNGYYLKNLELIHSFYASSQTIVNVEYSGDFIIFGNK